MELWIRSQDKTILSKAQNIIVRESQNENNETNYAIVDIYTMGIYKSKERALEVLDEIQNILVPKISCTKSKIKGSFNGVVIRSNDTMEIKEFSTFVYEMPKD